MGAKKAPLGRGFFASRLDPIKKTDIIRTLGTEPLRINPVRKSGFYLPIYQDVPRFRLLH